MTENSLLLPIPPTEESLSLLLRSRLMLSHALEHASQKTEFDNMIAILGLDNTIESLLRCVAMHLDLEGRTGKSFDLVELASLAGEINKSLENLAGIRLPYLAEIKMLRTTRNLVQHGAVSPNADLDRFSSITNRFFDKVLSSIFGLNINLLKISSVINDQKVRSFLQDSERFIEEKKWLLSIVASRDAFENEYFKRVNQLNISMSLYPSIVSAVGEKNFLSYGFESIKQELELSYLGINDANYRRFNEYLNHIPREYCPEGSWGQIVMQRPWNKDDAVFCYTFAANTILRWQAKDKEKLYVPELDKKYVFVHTINDIDIAKGGEIGCLYSYQNGHEFVLSYVPKATMKLLDTLLVNGNYLLKVERFVDDILDHSHQYEVKFLGYRKFLVVNNPECWGVILWYQQESDND